MTPSKYAKPFWSWVKKGNPDECWEWQGYRDVNGYGHQTEHQVEKLAHRKSWELTNGAIPDGLFVLHRCDNPSCVNPNHLFLGTQADNMRDCQNKHRNRWVSKPGEANPAAKLSREQVISIFKARNHNGEKLQSIADRFGVTPQAIWLIAKGIKWSTVTRGITR